MYSKIILFLLFLPYLCIQSETVHNCKKLWGVSNKINQITLSSMNIYICIDDPYKLYNNNDQFTSSIELIENSDGSSDETLSTTTFPPANQYNISNISNVSHINITNNNNFTKILNDITTTTEIPSTTTEIPSTTTEIPSTTTEIPSSPITTFSPRTTTNSQKINPKNNHTTDFIKNITYEEFNSKQDESNIQTIENNGPIIITLTIVCSMLALSIITLVFINCKNKKRNEEINKTILNIPQPLYKHKNTQQINKHNTKINSKKTNRRIKPKNNNSPPIIMKKSPTKRLSKTLQKKQFKGGEIPTYDVKLSQNMPRDLTPTTKNALSANGGEHWYKNTFSSELGLEPPMAPPPLLHVKNQNFEPPIPKRNFKNAVKKVGVANGIKNQVNKFENRLH
tara:strand:- start:54 stop:1241 length:1188 start_codon:yes stop_codon:yes gene_type:complete